MSLSTVDAAATAVPPEEPAVKGIEGRTPLQLVVQRLRTDRVAIISVVVIVLIIALAIGAPLIAAITGHGPTDTNVDNGTDANGQPLPPGSAGYLLGTDNLGRDILVRIAYGARVSLIVGVVATAIATIVGVVVGLFAGYYGGWLDSILARIMDVVLSFPYVLFAIVLVSVFGSSLPLTILVIAFFSFAAIGRIVRGQARPPMGRSVRPRDRSGGSASRGLKTRPKSEISIRILRGPACA